jgi:DNA mismatch repair protein MutS
VTATHTRGQARSEPGARPRPDGSRGPDIDVGFGSILFGDAEPPGSEPGEDPDFFVDLNLDQVVDQLTAGREEYRLRSFFTRPSADLDQVSYRQDVLADLDDEGFAGRIRAFGEAMQEMRKKRGVAAKLHSTHQRNAWILDAAATYCAAVADLQRTLAEAPLTAEGWLALRRYVTDYTDCGAFTALVGDVRDLQERLAGVTYCIRIRGGTVGVSRYEGQTDYTAEVTATFAKFRQGEVDPRRFRLSRFEDMNHVEAQVLDRVAVLFPDTFGALGRFVERYGEFVDATIGRFDREVQFYLAYLQLIAPLRAAGLPFCRPEVVDGAGDLRAQETFDLALADKLIADRGRVVRNDLELAGSERIIVVTGPNQGGKTTLARAFGQLHHLAALGLLVPGTSARLPLADGIFTQFERGENMADLSGKLADDLNRIRAVLERATERSVVVVNEIFTSTTLDDALFLGRKVLGALIERGCLAVYVTFVDELASLGPEVVSMVSTVEPDNPAIRTLKVIRRPADGLAYADVLARKYGLTTERITERVTGRVAS